MCFWVLLRRYEFLIEKLIFVMNLLGFCKKRIIVLTFKKIKDLNEKKIR